MRFGHKYGAKKTECAIGKHMHDSKREANQCDHLSLLLSEGKISDMVIQQFFPFVIDGKQVKLSNGHKAGITVDFAFQEDGKFVAADVKGFVVRDFPIRWAIAKALYPDWEWRIYK